MRRRKTKALEDFINGSKRPTQLLRMDMARYSDPPTSRQAVGAEALRGGSLVLLVATFEKYLKSVFDELCDELEKRRRLGRRINVTPDFILENNLGAVEYVIKESRLDRKAKHTEIIRIGSKIARGEYIADGFIRTAANPSSEIVKLMIKRWGISVKIDNTFQTISGNFYNEKIIFSKLDEIISHRNEVAHTGSSLNISRNDLSSYIKFLVDLAITIDKEAIAELKRKY